MTNVMKFPQIKMSAAELRLFFKEQLKGHFISHTCIHDPKARRVFNTPKSGGICFDELEESKEQLLIEADKILLEISKDPYKPHRIIYRMLTFGEVYWLIAGILIGYMLAQ